MSGDLWHVHQARRIQRCRRQHLDLRLGEAVNLDGLRAIIGAEADALVRDGVLKRQPFRWSGRHPRGGRPHTIGPDSWIEP